MQKTMGTARKRVNVEGEGQRRTFHAHSPRSFPIRACGSGEKRWEHGTGRDLVQRAAGINLPESKRGPHGMPFGPGPRRPPQNEDFRGVWRVT